MKKVSLILTTYNCKKNFQSTMESILMQDYPEIEIVIADGGSTDGTKELIEFYEKDLGNRLVWRSEEDDGIYDAMNKGYRMSSGELIAFFNDCFIRRDAVTLMAEAVEKGGEQCIGAHADLIYADGEKVIRYWKMGKGKINQGWMPGHPTLYLKRHVYEQYGLYDTSYKCSADYEFMIRILKEKEESLVYVPKTILKMYYGGTSTGSTESYIVSLKEAHNALRQNGVKNAWWIDVRRTFRVLGQFWKAKEY
ncbi:MAG: glycosyltransferase [Lachnospiraceae bacterium]|nr:glycosyltransferase [Lachnospiraceae bacterium]